ncbi:hypothetical protein MCUN1_003286 [Malassezia cuniculi]|uniref:Transmembrane protein n=1 Tax=Malassezia cuniculi TaxID=948313 RepID=A0AAF0EX91_9BASI|nr:hypothetical protein MCUN1_003286 [Malassezia cuniculi]
MQSPGSSSFSAPGNGITFNEVSRARLIFFFALAHAPAVGLLLLVWFATHKLLPVCNIQLLFSDATSSECAPVLSNGVELICVMLGIAAWRIAFELKLICWEAATIVARALGLGSLRLGTADELPEQRPYTLAVFTAFMRSLVVEALRLLSLELCVSVVIAAAWGMREKNDIHASGSNAQCWLDIDDPRFILTLWLGAGWTIAEVASGSWQMIRFLPLLRSVDDVLPELEEDVLEDYVSHPALDVPPAERMSSPRQLSRSPSPAQSNDSDAELFLASDCSMDEDNLSIMVLLREKDELEAQLGEPLENLSAATVALWRIDSVLWNLASSLVISASFSLAQGCSSIGKGNNPNPYPFLVFPPFAHMASMFSILVLIHTVVTAAWMILLPRFGATTVTYMSLLLGLGLFFVGLARWGAVV